MVEELPVVVAVGLGDSVCRGGFVLIAVAVVVRVELRVAEDLAGWGTVPEAGARAETAEGVSGGREEDGACAA